MSDPIADALTRIKNGYMAGLETVVIKYSKIVVAILKLLLKEGYLSDVKHKNNEILVSLKYISRRSALTDIKRVSRPSLRVYKGAKDLPKVLGGRGCAIISTPKGIMTEKEAKKQKVGGEVIALVW